VKNENQYSFLVTTRCLRTNKNRKMVASFFLVFIITMTSTIGLLFCCNFCGFLEKLCCSKYEPHSMIIFSDSSSHVVATVTAIEVVEAYPLYV